MYRWSLVPKPGERFFSTIYHNICMYYFATLHGPTEKWARDGRNDWEDRRYHSSCGKNCHRKLHGLSGNNFKLTVLLTQSLILKADEKTTGFNLQFSARKNCFWNKGTWERVKNSISLLFPSFIHEIKLVMRVISPKVSGLLPLQPQGNILTYACVF